MSEHEEVCPVCEEPFDSEHEFYPDAEVVIKATEQDEGKICLNATVNSASPDPLLELYKHLGEQ